MSLILEALKKVERERATPEQRGFLVLGPAAWSPSRSNLGWVLGMIGAAAVAGGAVYVLTRPEERAVQGPAPAPPGDRADARPAASAVVADATPEPYVARPLPAADPAPAPSAAVPDRAAPETVLVLHAISQQDGVPVAVVNDRVVREGDLFDGVRIVRIGAADVEIEVDGTRRTLRF